MRIERILWGAVVRKSSAVIVIAGGSVGTRAPDGQQHTCSAGPASCQQRRLLMRLLPWWCSSQQETRLCFLHCWMGWGGDTPVLAKGLCQAGWYFPGHCFQLGYRRQLVYSVTLRVTLSSPVLPYTHINFLHHHISRPNSPSLLIHGFLAQKPWQTPTTPIGICWSVS